MPFIIFSQVLDAHGTQVDAYQLPVLPLGIAVQQIGLSARPGPPARVGFALLTGLNY
mgnify:CR=1 FL=1